MRPAIRLTMEGLIRALRTKAHELTEEKAATAARNIRRRRRASPIAAVDNGKRQKR